MPRNDFPVEPLREAFLASGQRPTDIAHRLGWYRTWRSSDKNWGDAQRVNRTLGIKPYQMRGGMPMTYRQGVTYEMAAKLARAIGVDPHEVGL